jgi:hypothetical protein
VLVVDRSGHRSPLLSTLGIVALAGAAAPLACRDRDGGPAPIDDFSDIADVYEGFYAFYCECYAEAYGYTDVDECLAEGDIFSDSEEACLTEVFDANPAAFEIVRCQAEALRGYYACRQAQGCAPTFACSDGSTVPEPYVCDGEPDCADGSDEEQMCPAPFMCGDGQELGMYSICDGFQDCADGSDEVGCPPPFVCGDGSEISPDWVCDAEPDCEDGSDEEQMCPETCESRWLTQGQACGELGEDIEALMSDCYGYTCFDGVEIGNDQVCDGTDDCASGEDEGACPSMSATGVGSDGGSDAGSSSG